MGAPFGPNGENRVITSYNEDMDKYVNGAWDASVSEHKYIFEHEPLVTTFQATKEEVQNALQFLCMGLS